MVTFVIAIKSFGNLNKFEIRISPDLNKIGRNKSEIQMTKFFKQ